MGDLKTTVKVGISDQNIVMPPKRIRTSGLGSCVGIVIYDLPKKIAGLAHIMLPDSKLSRQKKLNHFKYADTAIPILIEKLFINGARRNYLQAKLAGGAQMFQFSDTNVMRIGERNITAVQTILKDLNIPVVAADVGGSKGRTIEFDPSTGLLKIRTVRKKEFYI